MEEDTKVKNAENTIDCYITSPDYGGMIIETISKVHNQGALEYLHTFIKLYLEKWG